jgi:hypothetical protein
MTRRYGLLLILLASVPLFAVTPSFWESRTWDDFRKGKFAGVSLTSDGELVLAPRFESIFDTEQPFVFSAVSDSKGNVYLGTGHDGRIYRVSPQGAGELVADLAELDVFALAVDSKDTLYAGASPDGKIYKIEPGSAPKVFFDPRAKYIWALAFDREGRLLAGTGDKGVIYRITPDGRGEPFYDTDETNIVSLAVDRQNNLIAGGDPKGYVYRISPVGKAFVLFDSGMRETHTLAIGPNGSIYAGLVNTKVAATSPGGSTSSPASSGGDSIASAALAQPAAQRVEVVIESAEVAVSAGDGPRGAGAPAEGGASGMIIEIRPDGVVNTLWRGEEMIYALLPRDGKLLFATGTKGRIYALTGARETTLLVESTEEQTTRLLEAGGNIFAASASAGKLFRLGDAPAASGSYESTVRDAETVSSWGRLTWMGRHTTLIELYTRTGNTRSPDKTWSDWARVDAEGVIASPKARFIQWKAALKSDGPRESVLNEVTVAYMHPNFPPEITVIEALPQGVALAKQATNLGTAPVNELSLARASIRSGTPVQRAAPRRVPQKGAQSFQWTAVDRNQDLLRFDLYYRDVRDRAWKLLKADIEDAFFTLESDALSDGTYVARVVVSDVLSNPAGASLTGEMESRPFIVDNTPPAVTWRLEGEGAGSRVRITAADATSTLVEAQIAVDAGEWRPIFPDDGILDSKSESFTFAADTLAQGDHSIAFRIYDQTDNVGSGKFAVSIPRSQSQSGR